MKHERGIALILVLVMLPLVAIIMVQLHFETTIGDRLARNLLANQQFKQAIHARRRHMQLKLVKDLVEDEKSAQESGAYDHYSDDWGPDTEGGSTSQSVKKGDPDQGDEIEIYTEIIDEQGKFNLNLLRHSDVTRRGQAEARLTRLLDFFRDTRFGDVREDHEFDVTPEEAGELAKAIIKFVRGEDRDERVPKSELPRATADMPQGLLTVEDLVFSHRLFVEKRLLDHFTDTDSGQVLPSFAEFVTVYGDGRINANTAPIQVLRAMFVDDQGWKEVAEAMLAGRGGFLNNDQQQEDRLENARDRREAEENDDSPEELDKGFKSINDVGQVEGMNNQPFLRRNNIEIAREFTVRTNFFTLIITAKRGNFMRQHRLVLERHPAGVETRESEIRRANLNNLPQGIPGLDEGQDERATDQ